MKVNDILKHNITIQALIGNLHSAIKQAELSLIPPCEFCKFDGGFRCEDCKNNYFLEGDFTKE